LGERLRALGAEPILFPVITILPPEAGGPLDEAVARLADYDWLIFTSVNGVEHFWARLTELVPAVRENGWPGAPFRGKIAAIGPKTAAELHSHGVAVDLMPEEYRAEAILDEIGDVAGLRILLPRADIARPALARGLRAAGAHVEEVTAYRTVQGHPPPAAFDILRAGVDVLTFTSSSTVRYFVALTDGLDYGDPLIGCIGPVTAATAHELGLHVDIVAKEYTVDGLLEALEDRLKRDT
jgi:uroporphyrinogen-III synthase